MNGAYPQGDAQSGLPGEKAWMEMMARPGLVRMTFHTAFSDFWLNPTQARQLARLLMTGARQAEAKR